MIERCSFDSFRDNEIVYPNLAIDLEAALRTGQVFDSGTAVEYNGIEDPNLIRCRVSDNFDAIDERNAVVHKELNRIKNASNPNPEDLPKE